MISELLLWHRLRTHRFGDPSAALDLRRRLAREQGWSLAEADHALEEYRRFCFLACAAGHPVTPSEAVDQVWHLHLIYTEDYWLRFCPEVLGTALHHGPTRGGPSEARRYAAQYAATLKSYEHYFGPPPERWWPSVHERFRAPERYQRIDRERYWLIPKPRLPRRWLGAMAGLGLPIQAQAVANPLDWTAWPFLELYLLLMVLVGGLTWAWRRALRGPAELPATGPLDPPEIAYLSGGPERVFDATIAALLDSGHARWDEAEQRLHLVQRDGLAGLAAQIAGRLATQGDPRLLAAQVRPLLEQPRRGLERRGLWIDAAREGRAALWLGLLPTALALFGVAKIAVGLSRGKPVGFITLLTLLTAGYAVVQFLLPLGRTRRGDAVLREIERRHERVRRAPTAGEFGLAVALAGTSVLLGSAFAGYHTLRQPSGGDGAQSSDSGNADDGSGGGGSGCGGCGGGGD